MSFELEFVEGAPVLHTTDFKFQRKPNNDKAFNLRPCQPLFHILYNFKIISWSIEK